MNKRLNLLDFQSQIRNTLVIRSTVLLDVNRVTLHESQILVQDRLQDGPGATDVGRGRGQLFAHIVLHLHLQRGQLVTDRIGNVHLLTQALGFAAAQPDRLVADVAGLLAHKEHTRLTALPRVQHPRDLQIDRLGQIRSVIAQT